jgi:ParB family chromosome partitioning protein
MLGKGLESLIPDKRNSQQGGGGFDGGAPQQNQQPQEDDTQEGYDTFERPGMYEYARRQYAGDQSQTPQEPIQESVPEQEQMIPTSESSGNRSIEERISGPVFHLEVESIVLNPYQPRKTFNEESLKELASSIRELGILQPLVVTKEEKETEFGRKVGYQLIAGQRRLMAAKMLGLNTVPAIVRTPMRDTEALEMAIVENIQRADLSSMETARAYARLSDEFGLTQREIAIRMGKSREAVANALRLLSLPSAIQDAIHNGDISESHARVLMQVEDLARQQALFDMIVSQQLSVRELKKRMQAPTAYQHGNATSSDQHAGVGTQQTKPQDPIMRAVEKSLADFLGAPVRVDFSDKGGKIIIHFYSPEEAQGIVQRIRPQNQQEY